MKTARTRLAFSVLIVMAMIGSGLGVGYLSVTQGSTPAVSGPAGDLGTRSEGSQDAVSLMGSTLNEVQEDSLPTTLTQSVTTSEFTPVDLTQDRNMPVAPNMGTTNGVTTRVVSNDDRTRSPGFDAGGPYGGPDCFEGSCTIVFEITTDDPTLIFFRWDFNNDGIPDTGWLTETTYTKTYYDNYYNDVVAEGWDGVSTTTYFYYGNTFNEATNYYWGYTVRNLGWKFRAKVNMAATELGFYRYYYPFTPYIDLRIYDFASRALLGTCSPSAPTAYAWYWCTLSSPIPLTLGTEYMISGHKGSDSYTSGYWVMYNNPTTDWEVVEYQGMHYATGSDQFPYISYGGGTTYVPMFDFQWRRVEIVPLTVKDSAFLQVMNVAPIPSNVVTNPAIGLEGSPFAMSASFEDPGTEDDWWFRWNFGDGSPWSDWRSVNKYAGGANVLLYHSITGNEADMVNNVADLCGAFCKTIDLYDFGPLGEDVEAPLDLLLQYDVIFTALNYFPVGANMQNMGDTLADFMDIMGSQGSGGVILEAGMLFTGYNSEIRGRFITDEYSPINPAATYYSSVNIGTIYVPGHPLLDGVTTLTSSGIHLNTYSVAPGATRIADFTDGRVMLATKENPVVSNGARAAAYGYFGAWYQCSGDCYKIPVNAIRWTSRQPDPTPLPMPIQLPWQSHAWADDDPTTTSPQDTFTVTVQVKDDDHEKIDGTSTTVLYEDFQTSCSTYSFPPGWNNNPYYGWRCQSSTYLGSLAATIAYYYNDFATSLLTGPSMDLSTYMGVKVSFYHYWLANYAYGNQEGYVEASVDGGATWPILIAQFLHNNPGSEGPIVREYDVVDMAGYSDVRVRLRYESSDDWYWHVDNIKVEGMVGIIHWGLGEATGTATIANVPPTIVGGPSALYNVEAERYEITGMEISDPAVMELTEWTAYQLDMDDGTTPYWIYKGVLAPPLNDILIIHHACLSGNTCTSFTDISNRLFAMDLTGSVTGWNVIESFTAPSLSYMLGFDVIMWMGEWAYLGTPAWESVRIAVGNNMASWLDITGGAVVTMMATYDLSIYYGDLFALKGRYIDQDYGPFEQAEYPFANGVLGEIHYPDHEVIKGVTDVTSGAIHSGDLPTTTGGLRLASWTDGGAAVGVKEIANGGRSCAINVYTDQYGGAHASKVLRQCIGWSIGGIPSPTIPPISHVYGDNGKYFPTFTLIDDDMGWVWDFVNNEPVADPMYVQSFSYHTISVEVDNVDPTISNTAAWTTADLCLRLSGNKGNDATLTVMGTDGSYYSVTTTRVPGKPNVGCLPTITIDMTPSTKYTLSIFYDPTGDDGANPEWIFESSWPGGKIHELRYTFNSNYGPKTVTIGNKQFKQLAMDSPITFSASASDPGSDDLVFAWIWGDDLPYDLNIYAHPGIFYTHAVSDEMSLLPFKEADFDKDLNTIRSPSVDPIRVTDTLQHTFSSTTTFMYVGLIVADDDVGDLYPSPYLTPGMDMEVVFIDV